MTINPRLFKLAADVVYLQKTAAKLATVKRAFQPPDPSGGAGGAPPDPSMGGGAPPMDPSMGGGAPPMDPSAGGAPPPPPGGGGGDLLSTIMMKLDQMTQSLQMAPQNQQGPGGAPGAPGKPGKPDLLAMSQDIFQIKKILFMIANAMSIEIPPEILDGPNRDPTTGAPMPPGAPGSTSDPNVMMQQAQQAASGAGAGGGGGGGPSGGKSSIPPIEPIQPAAPGAGKTAGAVGVPYGRNVLAGRGVIDEANALAFLLRGKKGR